MRRATGRKRKYQRWNNLRRREAMFNRRFYIHEFTVEVGLMTEFAELFSWRE